MRREIEADSRRSKIFRQRIRPRRPLSDKKPGATLLQTQQVRFGFEATSETRKFSR